MNHYEARLERDLNKIRDCIETVGTRVEQAMVDAVNALLGEDRQLANWTILRDQEINRLVGEIDRRCHSFVARHLPSAGHLRFLSSALRLNIALERIGDYSVTICREALQLSTPPPEAIRRDLDLFLDEAKLSLKQSLKAFRESNAELARGTASMAGHVSATYDKVFGDLIESADSKDRPLKDLFSYLLIFNRLSRICDQAKNICEETIFTVSGQVKPPKKFDVLFLDRHNDGKSQMALAIAEKAFPGAGGFHSGGWESPKPIPSPIVAFMESKGYDLSGLVPRKVDVSAEFLNDFDLVISLEEGLRSVVPIVPYRTVLLEWDDNGKAASEMSEKDVTEAYEQLLHRICGLMELLRGEDVGNPVV